MTKFGRSAHKLPTEDDCRVNDFDKLLGCLLGALLDDLELGSNASDTLSSVLCTMCRQNTPRTDQKGRQGRQLRRLLPGCGGFCESKLYPAYTTANSALGTSQLTIQSRLYSFDSRCQTSRKGYWFQSCCCNVLHCARSALCQQKLQSPCRSDDPCE